MCFPCSLRVCGNGHFCQKKKKVKIVNIQIYVKVTLSYIVNQCGKEKIKDTYWPKLEGKYLRQGDDEAVEYFKDGLK